YRQQCRDPGNATPGAYSPQALGYQYSIVLVEPDDIRDRAQRHEVQVACRYSSRILLAFLLQGFAERRHDIEGDADSREVPAAKRRPFEVRVDDSGRVRQLRTGKAIARS